jgi:hypothetical protein
METFAPNLSSLEILFSKLKIMHLLYFFNSQIAIMKEMEPE